MIPVTLAENCVNRERGMLDKMLLTRVVFLDIYCTHFYHRSFKQLALKLVKLGLRQGAEDNIWTEEG
jgi:hypothetical protein